MHARYKIHDTSKILSPSLIFYKEIIQDNLNRMIEVAGGPQRLRPHVKTHKTREIARMQLDAGITKLKCATIAEAEMLAQVGTPDILLSYNLIGPNMGRFARLMKTYGGSRFSALVDHPKPAEELSAIMTQAGLKANVLLDLEVGQHRTGIAPGPDALKLYEKITQLPGLVADGLHVYDGHNHQETQADRGAAVQKLLEGVLSLKSDLDKKGLPVPRMVVGGTPTFPLWAKMDLPGMECSPGTCILHDNGYGSRFGDLAGFEPAALLLTRVISRPTKETLTLDLGYKAVASDPPAGKRCVLLNVPGFEAVLQNEEHFVVKSPEAESFQPGDVVFAIPTHICPTSAMHKFAYVVDGGNVTEYWEIVGRDRVITI